MKTYSLILVLGALCTSLPAFASSKDFFRVLKKSQVERVTDPIEFQTSLQSLLSKNWEFADGKLTIHYYPDPKADAQPDFSEFEVRTLTPPADLLASEIGIYPAESNGSIYGGPFVVGKGDQRYAFIITVDDNSWGYDRDRYFVIYKKWSELQSNSPNQIVNISHHAASDFKTKASYPLPLGFQSASAGSKKILTDLSNHQWKRTVTFQVPSGMMTYDEKEKKFVPSSETYQSTWSNSLKFEFWNEFNQMNYSMKINRPDGSHSIGPFTEIPKVFALGEKLVSPGVHQFAIMAGNTWAMYQDSNRADYLWTNEEFFNAKDWASAEKAHEKKYKFNICHRGHDCSQLNKQTQEYRAGNSMEAGLMILEWNESQPDKLKMILHMTHPLFEGHTSTFYAE
ncbi:MAG: hypothetical protein KA715_06955 [Xanthomonadaceae bacterium]|nr:hypothetical protein [Xanthomonadaceae bacterium]